MVFDLLINLLMSRHLIMTWLGSDNCLRIAVERGNPFISNMLAAAAGPEGRTELDELFCKAQAQFLKDFG
jgi:hypothetical protein